MSKAYKIQKISRKDQDLILDLYLKTYLAQGETWTKEELKPFIQYLLKRPLKLKLLYQEKIIWGFVSDIKPWHTWNMLFDPELFIDPEYQKLGFWNILLKTAFKKAIKNFQVSDLLSFTFPDSYQLKWYQKMGMKTDNYRQMLYGNLSDLIEKMK